MQDLGPFEGPLFVLGGVRIYESVVTSFVIILLLLVFSWGMSKKIRLDPGSVQVLVEGVVMAMEEAIEAVLPGQANRLLPFIATLWIFIFTANLVGLLPGLSSPTSDLSVTAALATLVFFSVHWFGIRAEGLKAYLRHYLSPTAFMLPFHLIGELTRTLALAIRLFGNMMSLGLTGVLVLYVAGPLVPIPILMLHVVEGVIQAYLFGMLALLYIAGGIKAHETMYPQR